MNSVMEKMQADSSYFDEMVLALVDRRVEDRLAKLLDLIRDLDEFIRVWQDNEDRRIILLMGFTQFSGTITRIEALIPISIAGISPTLLFRHKELQNRQLEPEAIANVVAIGNLLDKDEVAFEANIRIVLGD